VGGGDAWLTIRYDQIRSIVLGKGIVLSDEVLTPYHDDEYMLRIGRDLLDQQIIDVTGRKVVRVNDVTMGIHHDGVRDTLTCSGSGYRRPQHFPPPLPGRPAARWIRRLQRPIPPNSIRWDLCNVVEPDPLRRLRLNISYEKLEQMHPADLADIVEELSPAEREAIFETIDSEAAADALSEVDPKMQASILESLEPEKAADIVEEMAPDEAADILSELEEETSEEILDEMDSSPRPRSRSCSNSRRTPPAA
jgi:magnesium transporter